MAADNNLSPQAVDDIIQMEKARIPSSVNVIVQLDPYQYSADPQARRYKITHNTAPFIASPVVEFLGDIDSGDYRSLADFVNWGVSKYPANRYALVIWSHGTGWTRDDDTSRYICPDNTSLSNISIAGGEFKSAFQLFPRKMDILLIDACHMQTIEVITEVYQFNDYIVASENTVPVEGFPYKEILELWNHYTSPQNLAVNMAIKYYNSYLPGGSQNPEGATRRITSSVAKTSQLPHFLNLLEQFVINWKYTANSQVVIDAREAVYSFNIPQSDIDLKEFFVTLHELTDNTLLQADIEEIIIALDNLFIVQESQNLPLNTGTATIWFPVYIEYLQGSASLYSNLDFALTGWLNYIESYFSTE
ncbi:MAG: hypothetical protein K0B81_03730 [Candidatus Cloacimonetes bacterium]|nr:hypothetical protein [Candidatus Cloacimonadota bacterium]